MSPLFDLPPLLTMIHPSMAQYAIITGRIIIAQRKRG